MKNFLLIISSIFIFSACAVSYKNVNLTNPKKLDSNMQNLALQIQSLSKKVDKKESLALAFDAINYSKYLANQYKVVAPALFHNTLINMNLKSRGLCYHYANDLLKYLKKKNYKSFKFIKTIANRGEYFEHTSIAITTDNTNFENSIILDAWRNTGRLFYSKVKNDKRYKWEKK